ncbi:MAG: radical SAM protein [Lachnospiraceae bacterium]|nr:radical SAM protein [Lachnospiraceae bacterium]
MDLKKRKVTILVAHYAWFDMRPWNEPTLSVPILTRILKPIFDLSLIDANADRLTVEETKERIAKENPEVVLITALSAEYHKAYHTLARIAKEVSPACTVVMGGVYPTVLAEDVIKDNNVDYAMIGYAEERLDKLVTYILEDNLEEIRKFPGLAYREEGKEIIHTIDTYIGDVEEMVKPDYSLVDLEKYIGYQNMKVANFNASSNKRCAMIITSYGCPNNCIFCATRTISGRKTAFRKPEDVLEEIDYLVENYHIDSIMFEDDSILTDRKRAEAIFQGIIDRNYNLELKVGTLAAWHLDEDILKLMKRAGFTRIGIAIESGCDRVLHQIIRKPLKLEIIPPLVKLFRKHGIFMTADFIIGFPGETWEDIRETFRFAESCDIDLCMFHIATVLPKTDLYKVCKEQNLLPDDFSFYNDRVNFGYCKGNITTDEFTPEELMVLRAYEWDRINFSTPEKRKRVCQIMEITEEQLEEHRKQTRRNFGVYC